MAKYCKQCWVLNENPLNRLCRQHYYEDQLDNPKKRTPIKKIGKKKPKWRVAKFTKETKEKIYARDKVCIFCWNNSNLHFHHLFFWTESIYTNNRNDIDQGVTACWDCHSEIHWCAKSEGKRQEAINYLITN